MLLFSVQFRTTPTDSTGVPHILEHTVLCGSARYPCRDPFFKMLSRSLSTFMNAFTGKEPSGVSVKAAQRLKVTVGVFQSSLARICVRTHLNTQHWMRFNKNCFRVGNSER